MPTIGSTGKILVTGSTGYIGAWIVKDAVDRGYDVLIAVRKEAQAKFIEAKYPAGKVTHIVVADVEAPDAYDEAVKDVDGIIHAASPVIWSWEDPSEVTGPAIKGATGILRSAQKFGPKVKRVVITSSAVAVVQDSQLGGEGTYFDETLWNESSPKELEEKGVKTSGWVAYCASKTLAEKAAWNYVKTEKPHFDLTTILPVWCWGPYIHDVSGKKDPGTTPAVFLSSFPAGDLSGQIMGDFVDVRDTAALHVQSLITPAAGGERILTNNRNFNYHEMYDVLLQHNIAPGKVPGAETKGTKISAPTPGMSNKNSLRIFPDFKYRSLETATKDMGLDFARDNFFP